MRPQLGRPQVVALLTSAALALPLVGALALPANAAASTTKTTTKDTALSTGTIGGLVTDTSGAPVKGVSLKLANLAKGTTGDATTDANGRYTMTTVPGSVMVSVVEGVPNYTVAKPFTAVNSRVVANKRTVLNFSGYFAKTFGTLSGTVTDTDDTVLPGVQVTLTGPTPADGSAAWTGTVTTNAKGVYAFKPIAGTYTVKITGMPDSYSVVTALLPVTVVIVKNQATTQDFSKSITRKTGSVVGLVRDNHNAVVPGVTVTYTPKKATGGAVLTTVTDATGMYSFSAPIGSGTVSITTLPIAWVFSGKARSQSVTLTDGAATTGDFGDAVNARGDFVLTGIVTDNLDQRVAHAQVKVSTFTTGVEKVTTVFTNANGLYRVSLPYGVQNTVTLGTVPRGHYLAAGFRPQDFTVTSNLKVLDLNRAYGTTATVDGFLADSVGVAAAEKAANTANDAQSKADALYSQLKAEFNASHPGAPPTLSTPELDAAKAAAVAADSKAYQAGITYSNLYTAWMGEGSPV